MSTTERVVSWIVGLSILLLVLWSAFVKPTDKSTYLPQSNPIENHNTEWPLSHPFDIKLSCTRSLQETMKGDVKK